MGTWIITIPKNVTNFIWLLLWKILAYDTLFVPNEIYCLFFEWQDSSILPFPVLIQSAFLFRKKPKESRNIFQVERMWDLVRDSGQRKLTYSSQNHCTLHFVSVGAKPLSPRQCAPSRSVYLSRRLYSHWGKLVITHHLQKWESSRLR